MKNEFIINKVFPPLDDLYNLLQNMQSYFNTEISEEDYIVGRKQLYYIFLHETMHAFVAKKAKWIYDLCEDETDFIDEVAARILIDVIIKEMCIYNKMDLFYENNVNHRKELQLYGYNLTEEQYDKIETEYILKYKEQKDIDSFCKKIHKQYKELGIKRRADFSYKLNT